MGNSQYNVTYLNYTNTFFLVSVEKGAPSVFYSDIFKGLLTRGMLKLKVHSPPPKKLRTRLQTVLAEDQCILTAKQ